MNPMFRIKRIRCILSVIKKIIGIEYIYKFVQSNRYYLYNKNPILGYIECKHIKHYREFYDRCTNVAIQTYPSLVVKYFRGYI